MAYDVEGARTGFIAADNRGSTLFRGDDSSGATIKETEHTGIVNGENKVRSVLEKASILGPGLLMANDFIYGIANNGSTLFRGKDLDNQVKTDLDRQDAFMSEVMDVGGLAAGGEIKAVDVAGGDANIFLDDIDAKNIVSKSANEVNNWWKTAKGYTEPPYTPGSTTFEFELKEAKTYARVYDGVKSPMKGQWFMKAEDIEGLTPKEIQDKFALPATPKYIVDLTLDAGSVLRKGEANPLFGLKGKGVQFDSMGKYIGEWTNPRLLP